MMTVLAVAALRMVADNTAYMMAQCSETPAVKVRGKWRLWHADIDTWIQQHTAARRDDGGADE